MGNLTACGGQARLELVNAIGLVYTSLGTLLEAQHMQDLYLWLERLVKCPMSAEDAPTVAGAVTDKLFHPAAGCT